MTLSTKFQSRNVERLVAGRPTSDGASVKLTRVLTQDLQQRLDPFLMLDNFGSDDPKDYGAGFPDHPHRGFETVTYMIRGRMRHKDSAGHEGLLSNGGVPMSIGKAPWSAVPRFQTCAWRSCAMTRTPMACRSARRPATAPMRACC